MNQIAVIQKNGIAVVDSRLVAEGLGIQHRNLLETIYKHKATIESRFGQLAFETDTDYQQVSGIERTKCAHLTEDQFMFIGSLSRNTNKVVEFKAALVSEFRKAVNQLTAPQFQIPATLSQALLLASQQAEVIEQQQHRIQQVEATNEVLTEELQTVTPIVQYAKEVLSSPGGMTTTQVAQDLGISAVALNKRLDAEDIIRKVGGEWVLTAKYLNQGLTQTRTIAINRTSGPDTVHQLLWTEKGRMLINEKVGNRKAA